MADSLNKKKAIRPEGDDTPAVKGETVTISDIEKLFSLMRENDIAELEIEQYKTKIHIVSKGAPAQQQMVQYMPAGMPQMQMMPMQSQQAPAPEAAPAQQQAAPAPAAEGSADAGDALPPNARTVLSP